MVLLSEKIPKSRRLDAVFATTLCRLGPGPRHYKNIEISDAA